MKKSINIKQKEAELKKKHMVVKKTISIYYKLADIINAIWVKAACLHIESWEIHSECSKLGRKILKNQNS